jgi:RHS repeat-associated protein
VFQSRASGRAEIVGAPRPGEAGTYRLVLSARNGVGRAFGQRFILQIKEPSPSKNLPSTGQAGAEHNAGSLAPTITSMASTSFTVGKSGSFSITTSGSPTPKLTESGTLPSALKFKAKKGKGTLSGVPAAGTGGTYVLTFTASNGVGRPAIQSFTLNVDQAPVFTSADSVTFSTNNEGSFLVTTAGLPPATLSETGTLPSGVTFSNLGDGTGTLAGTVSATGTYSMILHASNGVGTPAAQAFTLKVVPSAVCTVDWNGSSSNSWSTASNWTPARVPSTSDWACIPASAPHLPVQISGSNSIAGLTNIGGISVTGSLSITDTSQASSSAGELSLNGSLSVADALGVTGQMSVTGQFDGPGTVTVASGATFEVSNLSVDGGTLVNKGTATAEPSADLYLAPGAAFLNQGSLTLDSASVIYGGCATSGAAAGTMTSTGSITSAATSGFPASIGYPNNYYDYCLDFNDSGSITVASNELDLGGITNLNSGATISGSSSTTLGIDYGTTTVNPGASISGPGTINGNGTLVLNTSLSAPSVHVNTVSGPGDLTVTTDLDVSALDGPGTVTVASGATFEVSNLSVDGGTLVNKGTATAEPSADLYLAPGAAFLNQGSLTLDSASVIYGGCATSGAAAGTMTSTGSITSAATSGFPASIGYPNNYYDYCLDFNDSGSITVASNELDLGGITNLNSGATISGSSSTTLGIDYGTTTVNPGASISGPGTINGNGTLVLNTSLSAPSVHVNTVSGPGDLTVTTDLDVSALDGPGTVTIASGATFEVSNLSVDGGTLVNRGTGALGADATLYVGPGTTFTNQGSLSLGSSSSTYGGCATSGAAAGTMDNTGSITAQPIQGYSASLGTSSNCMVLNDSGTISVASDELDLGGVVNLNSGANVTGTSSTTLGIDGTLEVDPGSTFNGPTNINDNGTVVANTGISVPVLSVGGTLEIAPGIRVHATSVPTLTGTIELDGTGSFGQLNVAGGTTVRSAQLVFSNPSYSPPCGAGISAITSGSDSGTFASVSGGNLPSGGSWNVTGTSTSAGALVYCPPPPQSDPVGGSVPSQAIYGEGNTSMPRDCSCGAAEPVNLMSGNFYETNTDINVSGRGPNLNVTRTYNSLGVSTTGPFGYGWSTNLDMNLAESDSDTVATVTDEQGSEVVFTLSGGTWSAPPRNASTLTQNGSTWTYSRWDGESFVFNSSGQLTSQTDRNGNTETFTYNNGGNLTTVTDASGRALTLTWSGSHISAIKDPDGQTVTYGYDGAGDLTSVINLNHGTTTYAYTGVHLLTTITDPDSDTLTNSYNSADQVTEQVDPMNRTTSFSYATPNTNESTTLVTDPNGDETLYTFEYGVMVEMTAAYNSPLAATTTYTHDPVSLGVTSETDPDGNTTTTTYDSNGNVLTNTTPLGEETVNTYNGLNEVLTTTNPSGVTTTNTYDADGNLLTTSTPLLNGTGGTIATATTTYSYGDPSNPGLPTTMISPNRNTTIYTYDSYGDKTSVTNALDDKTSDTYDILSRLRTKVAPDGNVSGCGCSASNTTIYTYDPLNDVLTVTDPNGNKTTNTYNGDGGELTSTQPDGTVTTNTYDADNEVTQITVTNDSTVERQTDSTYDADGNVTSQTNGNGKVTSYTYNTLNQQTSSTNPLGQSTTTSYDGDSQAVVVADANGTTTSNSYNADGELIGTSFSDGTPPITYAYDPEGRKDMMTDESGTSTWSYDSLNRLTSYVEGNGDTVTYGYDLDGDQTSIGYPGGGSIAQAFNAGDQMQSLTDLNSKSTSFTYDASGNLIGEALPNGVMDSYSYDPADNLVSISDKYGSSSIFGANYTVNDENLITQDSSQPTASSEFAYDPLNQICYAAASNSGSCSSPPNPSEDFAYDGAGNPIENDGVTQAYNANSELCWTISGASSGACTSTPTGSTRYVYDADGNLTQQSAPDGVDVSLSYNAANEMVQYQTGSSVQTDYSYDGDGVLMSRTGNGTTSYAWNPSPAVPQLLETTSNGATTKYVYGPTGLPLEEILSNGSTYYFSHDNIGSTRVLSTSTGAVADTDTYGPYGAVLTSTGSVPNSLLYAGQYLDSVSGLYYMQARYYDPSIGQFTTIDPISEVTGQTYSYAANNPISYVDPSGEGLCLLGHNPNGSCRGATEFRKAVSFVECVLEDIVNAVSNLTQSSSTGGSSESGSVNTYNSNAPSSSNRASNDLQNAKVIAQDPTNPWTYDQVETQDNSPTCQILDQAYGSEGCAPAQNYVNGYAQLYSDLEDF